MCVCMCVYICIYEYVPYGILSKTHASLGLVEPPGSRSSVLSTTDPTVEVEVEVELELVTVAVVVGVVVVVAVVVVVDLGPWI